MVTLPLLDEEDEAVYRVSETQLLMWKGEIDRWPTVLDNALRLEAERKLARQNQGILPSIQTPTVFDTNYSEQGLLYCRVMHVK